LDRPEPGSAVAAAQEHREGIGAMTYILIVTQIVTLAWLFWLDQEHKALNRYVQGLRVPYEHPMRREPGGFA
jgi:hypothetical protein